MWEGELKRSGARRVDTRLQGWYSCPGLMGIGAGRVDPSPPAIRDSYYLPGLARAPPCTHACAPCIRAAQPTPSHLRQAQLLLAGGAVAVVVPVHARHLALAGLGVVLDHALPCGGGGRGRRGQHGWRWGEGDAVELGTLQGWDPLLVASARKTGAWYRAVWSEVQCVACACVVPGTALCVVPGTALAYCIHGPGAAVRGQASAATHGGAPVAQPAVLQGHLHHRHAGHAAEVVAGRLDALQAWYDSSRRGSQPGQQRWASYQDTGRPAHSNAASNSYRYACHEQLAQQDRSETGSRVPQGSGAAPWCSPPANVRTTLR